MTATSVAFVGMAAAFGILAGRVQQPAATNLGSDANGNPLRRAIKTGHVSNYDERKVRPYTLPDPLVLADGTAVRDGKTWLERRRPEILRLYETEIYGRIPATAPRVTWRVAETDAHARDGAAILKRLEGTIGDAAGAPVITVKLYTPAHPRGPVPVILMINMAQNFPWQFAGNFQKWVGRWNDMPVDAHMLIALSAPRPVFITGGTSDQWADPVGEFLSEVAAGPVYLLLDRNDLGVTTLPPLDSPRVSGDLGWHYHTGGHAATPADWSAFLQFLAKYFPS